MGFVGVGYDSQVKQGMSYARSRLGRGWGVNLGAQEDPFLSFPHGLVESARLARHTS